MNYSIFSEITNSADSATTISFTPERIIHPISDTTPISNISPTITTKQFKCKRCFQAFCTKGQLKKHHMKKKKCTDISSSVLLIGDPSVLVEDLCIFGIKSIWNKYKNKISDLQLLNDNLNRQILNLQLLNDNLNR